MTHTAELVDVLWAYAVPDDRLQHVSVRAGPNGVDLVLFLLPARDLQDARSTRRVDALLRRAYLTSPLLQQRYGPPWPASELSEAALTEPDS